MTPSSRILELCQRLMSPGSIEGKLSASEHHEICDFIAECAETETNQDSARMDWLDKNIIRMGPFLSGGGQMREHLKINLLEGSLRSSIDAEMERVK